MFSCDNIIAMNDKLTTKQAAKEVGVSRMTDRRWCQRGYIEADKVGRDWLIDPKSLALFTPRKAGRPKKEMVK